MDGQVPTAGPSMTLSEAMSSAGRNIRVGDLSAAAATLNDALMSLELGSPTPEIIDAAALFAHTLAGVGELGLALEWATWAEQASQRAYPAGDPRSVRPTQIYAQILATVGHTVTAATVYRRLAGTLALLDGHAGQRALCARADLATILHRAGDCLAAHTMLAEAWGTLCATYGDGGVIAVRMCVRLAMMFRDCADPAQAEEHFGLAGYHAGDDSALTAMVVRATDRAADLAHRAVCTHTPDPVRIYWPPSRPTPTTRRH